MGAKDIIEAITKLGAVGVLGFLLYTAMGDNRETRKTNERIADALEGLFEIYSGD